MAQSLKYCQPVLEHDVLKLQAQYALDIRQPGQCSAFDAPTVGERAMGIEPTRKVLLDLKNKRFGAMANPKCD